MFEAPAKRRRLSADERAPDTIVTNTGPKIPSPRRPSYLSPTKSSLSRSYPHLVERSSRRSLTGDRGRSLRDEVLQKKPAHTEAPEPDKISQPINAAENPLEETVQDPVEEPAGKEAPSAPTSTRPSARPPSPQKSPQSRSTQPRPSRVHGSQRASHFAQDALSPPIIMPSLVRRTSSNSHSATRSSSNEPELPPTPVQLGLDPAPDKPRGLASSSPRSSRSGSGRFRRRTQSQQPSTSSPLKPKARAHAPKGMEPLASSREEGDEAPESELEPSEDEVTEDLPPELQEKKSSLRSLQEELSRLKKDVEKLDNSVEHDQAGDKVLALLQSLTSDNQILPADVEALPTHRHFNLFAPGNLLLKHTTQLLSRDGQPKLLHNVTAAAPPPWLPNTFACTFNVVVDTETGHVENTRMQDSLREHQPAKAPRRGFFKWAEQRLQSQPGRLDIHRLDVAGVIWGMGKWFSATIERAKVFRHLDLQYVKLATAKYDDNLSMRKESLTQEMTVELSPYLEMTQLEVSAQISRSKKSDVPTSAKIMLVWDLDLDWTGEAVSNVSLGLSGMSTKAETGFKEVFATLYPSNGVLNAFESVWEMIHADGDDEGNAEGQLNGKRKRV
ncbi:hypothetical protein PV08_09072 [Exophiala spinifera]|uniref:Uncharacterized protein n=1 Tax=Exophiala spinifera TaxID=91928 RepID=A0A0D2AZA7_9EURO|nr:uncharacterized protein PV08_09072 [Exophiala spinifera]KIW11800.1 hypothetical protein PV08_09072 [Exophiala spinifera]